MTGKAVKLAGHMREYLLAYIFLAIIVAIPIGYYSGRWISIHKETMKDLILTLAILTLFPSMVQLRSERFGKEFSEKKVETLVALVIIFGVGPITAMLMADLLPHKPLSIGFVAANSVPASSASIAYVLLAEGNIEFATLLALISIIGALGAVPTYIGIYARSIQVSVPLNVLGESVVVALLTPIILGQLTRYYLVKRRARKILKDADQYLPCKTKTITKATIEEALSHIEEALECVEGRIEKKIKPYLSLWTMIAMLFLIGSLIAAKANLLLKKPEIAGEIILFQLVVYAVIIASLILATRILKLSYEDHSAMAFISITKNESVAAAVSVMAIGTTAAMPAALIPAIQPIIAILYLWALPKIRELLGMHSNH